MDRYVQFGVWAGVQALEDAGLLESNPSPEDTGVMYSSAIGGTATVNQIMAGLSHGGMRTFEYHPVGVELYEAGMFNVPAVMVGQRYGLGGPYLSLSTGCTAGIDTVGLCFELIETGEAKMMLAGASEAPLVGHAFATLDVIDALAKADPAAPEKASRPFDALRNGFVLGEGAAVLVLEELEHARRRGATIYGEMLSFSSTMNAYHMTDLHATAPEYGVTITQALERANVRPDEIEYINAHGSSTPQNDVFETNSFKAVFGERAYRIPISSTKSMIAHSLSAASSFGIIAVLGAFERSVIHPTANYTVPDPACDLDYVPNTARRQSVRTALVTASGFGGIHSAAVFRKLVDGEGLT
jgi:3-oxoacyl-(acyl-carrier-protein) synthase